MTVTEFPSFKKGFERLKEFVDEMCLVEFYHHEMPGVPSISVVGRIDSVFSDYIEGLSHIGMRLDGGTDLNFDNGNYKIIFSNGSVIFSSKHDNETYCIIDFMERK